MSADEISTLSSIYFGSENLKPLYSPIGKKYSITLSVFNVEILLEILVPVQYPLDINPIFTILKPETSNQFKEECKRELYSIWDHTREECLYSSIEWYFLSFFCYNNASLRGKFEEMYKEMGLKEKEVKEEKCHVDVTSKEVESVIQIPNVVHSNAVVVKKSKFIAHFARVKNHEEVAVVLHAIKSNKNYCDATHPCICAFILSNPVFVSFRIYI